MTASITAIPRIKKSTSDLANQMYVEIYRAIMGMELAPKTKLTERDLCEIYGLPRHQVRQVLAKLESDGLVDIHANRGAFIADPTAVEAREMFEVRAILEAAVLEAVVPSISDLALQKLSEMVEAERVAFRGGQRDTWVKLSAEFHIALARLTGNQTLISAITKYVTRTTLLISSSHPASAGSCSFDEHMEILEAIKTKDTLTAIAVMRSHLTHCEKRTPLKPNKVGLRAFLGKEQGEP
ncbi:MAG: GntR family transcriptional regulator [Burkholderiaceae bacterium]|jgi:DNA-binding GntR family transcriptional regulator|nr:GntR family transcriptional regulator [Burkholderiaceae bacterium]